MSARISVSLDEEQKARFEVIAAAREEPLETVVAEALTEYLDYDAEFRAAVEEGLADARAGRVYDFDDVIGEMQAPETIGHGAVRP